MNLSLIQLAKKFISERHRHKRWRKLILALAMGVVFVTTYMLILPAITLERQEETNSATTLSEADVVVITSASDGETAASGETAVSGEPAVVSLTAAETAAVETAGIDAASDGASETDTAAASAAEAESNAAQSESGTESGTICGLEEHTHTDGCYDADGNLICGKTEHTHNLSCYGVSLASLQAAEFVEGEFTYTISLQANASYKLTISAAGNGANYYNLPSNIMDSIGEEYRSLITKVVIDISGDNANCGTFNISESAFEGCEKIQEVEFKGFTPSTAVTIGGAAFSGCTGLKRINLEDINLKEIKTLERSGSEEIVASGGAFYNAGLTEITLPASWSNIGSYAFYGCNKLKTVNFTEHDAADSCTFGYAVFQNCSGLQNINLTALKNVTTISFDGIVGDGCTDKIGFFKGCSSLKTIVIPSNFHFNTDQAAKRFFENCSSLEDVVFEENHNENKIWNFMFLDCSSLKTLDLTPLKNVNAISYRMINNAGVETLKLPASVQTLSVEAFAWNAKLLNIEFAPDSQMTTLSNHSFYRSTSLTSVDLSSLTKLTDINFAAFASCKSMYSVKLAPNLTTIRTQVFAGCTNLGRLYYNAQSLTSIQPDAFGDFDGYSGSTDIVMTVAANVDSMPAALFTALNGHLKGLVFEGENSFTVTGTAATGLAAPLDTLEGEYYVSAAGDLYRKNSDGTYTFVYKADNGATDFTVPAAVNGAAVTGIGAYAFSGSAVTAVAFEKIENITNVAEQAFADAKYLASVAGKTTGDKAAAAFTNAKVNSDTAFQNTALGKSTELMLNGTRVEGSSATEDKTFTISHTGSSFLTGEYDEYSIAISEVGKGQVYRLYFTCGDDCGFNTSVQAIGSTPVSYHHVEGSDIHYYEIGPAPSGTTANMSLSFYYPNGSADGSKLKMWYVEGTADIFTAIGETAIMPVNKDEEYPAELKDYTDLVIGTEYFESVWNTREYNYPVEKSMKADSAPSLNKAADGQLALANLAYTVGLANAAAIEGDTLQNAGTLDAVRLYGADYVNYADFEDVLTLPAGLSWRTGLKAAKDNSLYRINIAEGKGSLYVITGGREYLLFSVELSDKTDNALENIDFDVTEDGKVKVYYRVSNKNCDLTESAAKETTAMTAALQFGSGVIIYDENAYTTANPDSGLTNPSFSFTNNIDTDEYYTYGKPYSASASVNNAVTVSKAGNISLSKEILNKIDMHGSDSKFFYFGEDVDYRVTAKNTSPFVYTADNGVIIKDELSSYQYIKPENMQAIFDAAEQNGGYSVSIEIKNATLAKTAAGNTVTAIDGETAAVTSVQNTGTVGDYTKKNYESDSDAKNTAAQLILEKNEQGALTLYVYGGTETDSYTIGEGGAYSDIDSALEAAGFIVTSNAQYYVSFIYPNGFPEDTTTAFDITATVKDSFMMLTKDNQEFYSYPTQNFDAHNIPTKNRAALYKGNGAYLEKDASVNLNAKQEMWVSKSIMGQEEIVKDAGIEAAEGTVYDYSVLINHYGGGSYELLPVVDNMTGVQALIVPVADNEGRDWTNYAQKFTYGGTEYYILKPMGADESYVFNGVTIGGYYADSVSVTAETDEAGKVTGYSTRIKWYIKDSVDDNFSINITYKAYVDREELNVNNNDIYFKFANTVFLNDRESHRLWDVCRGTVRAVGANKKIVTERGSSPSFDKLDGDDFTKITREENTVTYRLELFNRSSVEPITMTGASIYDALPPDTDGNGTYSFSWTKNENVSLQYVVTDGTEITYNGEPIDGSGAEWSIDNYDPALELGANIQNKFLRWSDEFEINFAPGGKAYIYVTMQYPGSAGNAEWKNYGVAHGALNGTGRFYNTLYTFDIPSIVSHELSDSVEGFLQKGVYETGMYTTRTPANSEGRYHTTAAYYRGSDRYTYVNSSGQFDWGDTKDIGNVVYYNKYGGSAYYRNGTVAYYVVLKNSSSNMKLHLAPIYDVLPKGFTFYSLRNNVDAGNGDNSNGNYNAWTAVGNVNDVRPETIGSKAGDSSNTWRAGLAWAGNNCSESLLCDVTLTGDTEVNGRRVLEFTLSGGNLEQEEDGTYYLKPGQSIRFGYECFTGPYSGSEDVADNPIVMEVIDTDVGVSLDTGTPVTVSKQWNNAPENNGSRELWGVDDTALRGFGFTADSDTKWFASEVKVRRGEPVPGMMKTVKDSAGAQADTANISVDSEVEWTVTAYNDGTANLEGYTIEDTVEAPQHFVGDVLYSAYTDDVFVRSNTDKSENNLLETAGDKLFTIQSRSNADEAEGKAASVNIVTNTGTLKEIPLDGTPVECQFLLTHEDLTSRIVYAWVSIKRDDAAGTETMKIVFEDDAWTIVPNGYITLQLHTKNITGIYTATAALYNTSTIIPTQSYDALDVKKGENVTNDDGTNYGVTDRAYISTDIAFPTSSLKTVTEKTNGVNTASGTGAKNYILLDDKTKAFTYTLTVKGAKTKAMNKLVLIDNLPQDGDTNTFSEGISRGSRFKVKLCADPNFKVYITTGETRTELDAANYTIQYSSKQSGFTNDDRAGKTTENSAAWTNWASGTDVSGIRSIRLIIGQDENTDTPIIPAGAKVELCFDAMIEETDLSAASETFDNTLEPISKAEPGETAWNTFGYQYRIYDEDGKANDLFAAPLKVGVRIPSVPSLSKSLTDSSGAASAALENETFKFVIYSGDKLAVDDYTPATVGAALALADIEFTYAELNVPAGASASELLTLKDRKKYTYTDGKFTPTADDWVWSWSYDGSGNVQTTDYHIIELDSNSHYEFTQSGSVIERDYTFTYNPAAGAVIKYVNMRPDWQINLMKLDENSDPLGGAVFGLYSPASANALNAEAAAEYQALYNAESSIVRTDAETGNEKKYYLSSVVTAPASGRIEWKGLNKNEYIVSELKAPDGYYVDQKEYLIKYKAGAKQEELSVINHTDVTLPETGGTGLDKALRLIGGLLAAATAAGLFVITRKRLLYSGK